MVELTGRNLLAWLSAVGALACPVEGGRETLSSAQVDAALLELFENASAGDADVQARLDFRQVFANAAGERLCEARGRVQVVISWAKPVFDAILPALCG
jgi:hypothetical protein